ncbi:MAG: tetratricopeptide repeat protein [Desulfobacterales bacterium]|nr:tetratricopeptide repeat protein [Desulfobacterales bacterium]
MSLLLNLSSYLFPSRIEKKCLDLVWKIDLLSSYNYKKAIKKYNSIISALLIVQKKNQLSFVGKEALGRAYYEKSLLSFSEGNIKEGIACFKVVSNYISICEQSIIPFLATIFSENNDLSDEAINAYINYLYLPESITTPDISNKIAQLLESYCCINDKDTVSAIAQKTRLNFELAALPGKNPCLVILGGPDKSSKYIVNDRLSIGKNKNNNVVLDYEGISDYHACIVKFGSIYLIQNIDKNEGIIIKGKRVFADTVLEDGRIFFIGSIKLSLYIYPRYFGNDLDWPLFYIGTLFFNNHEINKSLEFFKRTIESNPCHADAYYYMGQILQSKGSIDSAGQYYEKAVEHGTSAAWAHYFVGNMIENSKQDVSSVDFKDNKNSRQYKIIEEYQKAYSLEPFNDLYAYSLAKIYNKIDKLSDAKEIINCAISINPNNFSYFILLADILEKLGDLDGAIHNAEMAYSLDSQNIEVNYLFGVLCCKKMFYNKALNLLDNVIHLETASKNEKIFSIKLDFILYLGICLFEENKYVKSAITLSPIIKESRDAMIYVGRCYSRLGNFQKAAQIFNWGISFYGNDIKLAYYFASCLASDKKFIDAIYVIEEMEVSEEWTTKVNSLRARLFICADIFDEAQKILNVTENKFASDSNLTMEKGWLSLAMGEYQEAVSFFSALLENSPDDASLYYWIGRAFFALKNYKESRQHFSVSINIAKIDKDSSYNEMIGNSHYYLGILEREIGNVDKAFTHFNASTSYGFLSDDLAFEIAVAYAEKGEYAQALEKLSSIAMKKTNDTVVKHNLAAISCCIAEKKINIGELNESIIFLEQALQEFVLIDSQAEAEEVRHSLVEVLLRIGTNEICSNNGDIILGVSCLEKALLFDPFSKRCLYYLGVAYFRLKDYQKSMENFQLLHDEGDLDINVLKGLALSLDFQGKFKDAEKIWKGIIDIYEMQKKSNDFLTIDFLKKKIEAKLGLAGVYARREEWKLGADTLHELLDEFELGGFENYRETVKLAASYYMFADEYKMAEKLIMDHLLGPPTYMVSSYLGAVAALQQRPIRAIKYLKSAIKESKDPQVIELFELAALSLSAQKVILRDFQGAESILQDAFSYLMKFGNKAKNFMESVKTVISLKSASFEFNKSIVQTYEDVHNDNPDNFDIKKNLVIIYHKYAIFKEEEETYGLTEQYWRYFYNLFGEVISDDNFLLYFITQYNENKKSRDTLKRTDLFIIKEKILKKIADVHIGFALSYAAEGSKLRYVKRHCEYATHFFPDLKKHISEALLNEGKKSLKEKENEFMDLLNFIIKELDPNNVECRELLANINLVFATDALWHKNLTKATMYFEKIIEIKPLKQDLLDMVEAAAKIEKIFIIKIIDHFHSFLESTYGKLSEVEKKWLLRSTILNVCILIKDMTSDKRAAFIYSDNMQKSVISYMMESLSKELKKV